MELDQGWRNRLISWPWCGLTPTGTIGWSIATMAAVFLATLLAGVYSTLTITKGLQQIILPGSLHCRALRWVGV